MDELLHLGHSDPYTPNYRYHDSCEHGLSSLSEPFTSAHRHHSLYNRGSSHRSNHYTPDHRHHDGCDREIPRLPNPCASGHYYSEPYGNDVCQRRPQMDDMAFFDELYDRAQHSAGCPHARYSTSRDPLPQRDFELVDSLIHGCPACWRDHGRDYIPTLYSRPSYVHLELPALIRQAQDLETAQRIVRSNLNACLRNRELRRRDLNALLYPIRNRYGDYPLGFEEPRPFSWLRALDRTQRERMLRDYDLPYQLDELLDSTGYPRGLSYPPDAVDTLQTIAIAEACGARRAREEIEFDEMRPMLRRLGRNNFDGIGFGGLGGIGDGLGLGSRLDRLYRPLLRNQGLGLDRLAIVGDLMFPSIIDYAGLGRLGGRQMSPGWDFGGIGVIGRRGARGLSGMGFGLGGMGLYDQLGVYRGRGLSQLR